MFPLFVPKKQKAERDFRKALNFNGAPTLGSTPYYGTASELTPCFYYNHACVVHVNEAHNGQ